MSGGDEIRAGDVVVCVDDSPCVCCGDSVIVRGQGVYRVERAQVGFNLNSRETFWAVDIYGVGYTPNHQNNRGISAHRFRKIDAAEDCFTKAMQALVPLEIEVT